MQARIYRKNIKTRSIEFLATFPYVPDVRAAALLAASTYRSRLGGNWKLLIRLPHTKE